jgi:peptidoglycan/LPS O-acetylase OafA/YrhL
MNAPAPPGPDAVGQPPSRLPGLEALRGVAAICVLLLHTRAVFGGEPVFGKGYLGVDFFLMLSGYLMARVQEPRLAAGLDPWRFIAKRYLRLWPMMAAGGLLGIPRLFMRSDSFAQFAGIALANFLLLPVAFRRECFPLNIPAWTICFELSANFVHVHVLRRLNAWGLGLATAGCVPCVVWIALHYGSLDVGARPESLLAGAPRILFAYLIGIGLARWWRDAPPIPVPAIPAILAMPLVLAAGWWLGLGGWRFDLAFVVAVCPLMIAGALRLRGFAMLAGMLGQLSFPLFALQMPILQGMELLGFGPWAGGMAALAAGVCGAIAMNRIRRRWRHPAAGRATPRDSGLTAINREEAGLG